MRDHFEKAGFAHIKGLLSQPEVEHYKNLLQQVSGLNDHNFDFSKASFNGFSQADGIVKHEAFWPLIYHSRLVQILKELLPAAPKFIQHTDLHVHHGGVGWHRDNAHRKFKVGPDWDETEQKYSVLRVAFYLQSFDESQFKMGVIPRSHQQESLFNYLELKGSAIYRRLFGGLPPLYFSLQPSWIKMEPGDCLIFDQRLLHTGTTILGPKYSMYLAYGVDNDHAKRHTEYFYNRKNLEYNRMPNTLMTVLEEKQLLPHYFKLLEQ
jgi:hypothetical protein